jgi:Cysteine-rich secretory protein family
MPAGTAFAPLQCPAGMFMLGVALHRGASSFAAIRANCLAYNSSTDQFVAPPQFTAFAGNSGAAVLQDGCSPDRYLSGLRMGVIFGPNQHANFVQMSCTSLSGNASVVQVCLSSGKGCWVTPPFPELLGQTFVISCPSGQAAIGLIGRISAGVDALGLICAPKPVHGGVAAACAPNSGDPVPQAWADMLNAHNARRKLHCECPLSWSASLASDSQTYASKCALGVHGINGGENLADFVSVNVSAAGVVVPVLPAESNTAAYENSWYCEIANYLFSNPVFVGGFTQDCGKGNNLKVNGHFTQVMWKDTSQVGCGMQTCPMTVDQVKDGAGNVTATNVHSQGTHWVCRYKAPGNAPVDAATLTKEVLPPNCH